jgi:hypothetical protein
MGSVGEEDEGLGVSADAEFWRTAPGHDRYIVSNLGRVRFRKVGSPILRGSIGRDGYHRVQLDGVTRRVHRLVCEAFHGPQPSPAHEVAHGDGVRRNNHSLNLRWATRSENIADAQRHGTVPIAANPRGPAKGTAVPPLSPERVDAVRALRRRGLSIRQIAAEVGTHRSTVHRIVQGKSHVR